MYVRPDARRRKTQIPENYGGIAFSGDGEENVFIPPPTEAEPCCEVCESRDECEKAIDDKRSLFPIRSSLFNLEGEDLLLIGLILLLSQSDLSDDIVPLLLILLLC